MARLPKNRPPMHLGEMLLEEFLRPYGISQTEFAERIGISRVRVNEIVNQRRGITPDTALRLSRLFSTTPDVWLNAQLHCDLWHAVHAPLAAKIGQIEPLAIG